MLKVIAFIVLCLFSIMLSSCAQYSGPSSDGYATQNEPPRQNYNERLPQTIASNEKTIVVSPRQHVWGAYQSGTLVKAGLATAGGDWCPDIHRPCHTKVGSFRIQSLGSPNCKSSIYPRPRGGAPMPYCMFFNGNQGLHGSYEVVEGNVSHGCVRMQVQDAEWMRYNFANVGTRVVVQSY